MLQQPVQITPEQMHAEREEALNALVEHTAPYYEGDTVPKQVLMNISDNGGYAPSQIRSDFSLGDLLEEVNEAIARFGEDATIVLSNGQRYGAGYGSIVSPRGDDLFYIPEERDEY